MNTTKSHLSLIVVFSFLLSGLSSNGFAAPAVGADIDFDGDVDNYDLMTILSYAGGDALPAKALPVAPVFESPGDVDGNGIVDDLDFDIAALAFDGFGGGFFDSSSDATAVLEYNPFNGHLSLVAPNVDGGSVKGFIVESSSSSLLSANTNFPLPGELKTALPSEISQTHSSPFEISIGIHTASTASNAIGLGAVLPTGLDLAGLSAAVNKVYFIGHPGSDVFEVANYAIVPEPSTALLAGLGMLAVGSIRRQSK